MPGHTSFQAQDSGVTGSLDEETQTSNVYVQIATPKSPPSDGFSPTEVLDTEHPVELEFKQHLLNEIDLEILLKHREYNLVQAEISKVETQLEILQRLHDDTQYADFINNLISMKNYAQLEQRLQDTSASSSYMDTVGRRQTSIYSRRSTSEESKPQRTSYGGLRPVIDADGNKICVHKRSDNVIVRIICPTCERTDFGSAQGFLNHARLAHQVEFKSQDHAALMCGYVLADTEQDDMGLTSIKKLKEMKVDPDRNLAPNANGVSFDDLSPQKKKARRSSMKITNSGHLEKLYNQSNGPKRDEFKDLIHEVTARTEIESEEGDDVDAQSPNGGQETITKQHINIKKGHNRRKSRGGLSAVNAAFEDNNNLSSENISTPETDSDGGTNTVRFTSGVVFGSDPDHKLLTPSQRRRIPTIANPLRTRSRSSRENST